MCVARLGALRAGITSCSTTRCRSWRHLSGHSPKPAGVLPGAEAAVVRVAFPELDRRALVGWRLGMAQVAPFVATLRESDPAASSRKRSRWSARTALVRSMVVLTWQKPRG